MMTTQCLRKLVRLGEKRKWRSGEWWWKRFQRGMCLYRESGGSGHHSVRGMHERWGGIGWQLDLIPWFNALAYFSMCSLTCDNHGGSTPNFWYQLPLIYFVPLPFFFFLILPAFSISWWHTSHFIHVWVKLDENIQYDTKRVILFNIKHRGFCCWKYFLKTVVWYFKK